MLRKFGSYLGMLSSHVKVQPIASARHSEFDERFVVIFFTGFVLNNNNSTSTSNNNNMAKEDNFVYQKPKNIFTLINEENRRNAEVQS